MTYKKFKLYNSQLDIVDWVVDAMTNLPDDDQMELWGQIYESAPVRLTDGCMYIVNNDDVVEDMLYRIELQYLQMAKEQGMHVYNRQSKIVKKLSDMIRINIDK